MRVTVNGEAKEFSGRDMPLAAMLEALKFPRKAFAVELNGNVVRSADIPATTLKDGDKIEVVTFVGGG